MTVNNDSGSHADDSGPLIEKLQAVTSRLRTDAQRPMGERVAAAALELVPGARWCSITVREGGRFRSLAVSDEQARAIDQAQYDVGHGPCLDAIMEDQPHAVSDLTETSRWLDYANLALPLGVRSIFAQPLHLFDDKGTRAGLNLYSDQVGAFGEEAHVVGAVLATFGAMAVSLAVGQEHAQQLEAALQTNRDIGTALGVLMEAHGVDRDTAMGLLRIVSQNRNVKMSKLVAHVVANRSLPMV